ncbi:MAG: glycoside hydrolase family 31 protein [Bryobacterales bacterium]|nr:glycoside hydrolase family 31 protein [Bryobacterales bacterium]
MMGPVWLLALALASPWERQGNRFTLKLEDGRAELDWVSASTFRFARDWNKTPSRNRRGGGEPVEVSDFDTGPAVEFRTRYLAVEVRKSDLRLRVRDGAGGLLMEETAGARREGGAVVLEGPLGAAERIYGLGVETLGALDRRGVKTETERPFLWSSGGWGRYFPSGERHRFDLGGGRLRVEIPGAGRTEHYFYYGPAPKEILEQHLAVAPQVRAWAPADVEALKPSRLPAYAVRMPGAAAPGWEALAETVARLIHASLSAVQMPVFDLGAFDGAPEALRRRAMQLGMVSPLVMGEGGEIERWRVRLRPYLYAYFQEAHDRGIPVIRPLVMQFARDVEAAGHSDVFMFGDEFLAAPILSPGGRRELYLPMGMWTDLRTNATYSGRRTIRIEAAPDELPLFAKNGAVIPFLDEAATDRISAHYFPKLGGEFFLFEPDANDHTQLHASPAGDLYRFEIESKVDREYEWVAHHLPAPKRVACGERVFGEVAGKGELRPGTWFHDGARGNLHVRVGAAAGADVIVNVSFR